LASWGKPFQSGNGGVGKTTLARQLCVEATKIGDGRWHLGEVFVSINGRQLYVWRAVDSEGEVLDRFIRCSRCHNG
jgi:transposase-like protein